MKKSLRYLLFFLPFITHSQVSYFPPISGDDWETLSLAEAGWCTDHLDTLLHFLEATNTKAFLVLHDGKIVIEEYFGTTERESNLPWNSAGKTITGLMVGVAQQNGLLSLNDPTSDYLGTGWTSLTPEQEVNITIFNQLSMTSGLNDEEAFCVTPECLTYLADPGFRWAYHNGPYTLLTSVIEAASGMSMNNYIFQNLKTATGMKGLFVPIATNRVYYSPARSMGRMGLLMLNQGIWDNQVVLSDLDFYQQSIQSSQALNQGYGYLWWLNGSSSYMLPSSQLIFPGSIADRAPSDLFAGIGKDGQFLDVIPSKKLVVIRMGDAPNEDLVPLPFHNDMWDLLSNVICETTAADDLGQVSSSLIFPNPSSNGFYIKSAIPIRTIKIYSTLGQLMASPVPDDFINTDHLTPGIYWLKITFLNGQTELEKIVCR